MTHALHAPKGMLTASIPPKVINHSGRRPTFSTSEAPRIAVSQLKICRPPFYSLSESSGPARTRYERFQSCLGQTVAP